MSRRVPTWLLLLIAFALVAPTALVAAQDGGDELDDEENETDDERDDDADEADEADDDERDEDADDAHDADEAEAEDDDEDDERDEDEQKHEVSMEVGDDEAQIELKREDATSERKVEFGLETGDEATIEVKFELENETSEFEDKLEAEFHRLIEYVDDNGNGQYDAGETVASAWLIGDDDDRGDGDDDDAAEANGTMAWAPLTANDTTADDGTPGKQITARASFGPDGNATFGLDLFVFGDFAELNNATLEPTAVKIDILIDQYPYVGNDTALALILSTETKREVEHEAGDDGEGVATTGSIDGTDFRLEFTWLDTANVDGTDHPVRTTVLETRSEFESEMDDDGSESEAKNETTFALSYARGETIVHDPKAAVHYATQSADSDAATPGVGLAVLLGMVAAMALIVRRRG